MHKIRRRKHRSENNEENSGMLAYDPIFMHFCNNLNLTNDKKQVYRILMNTNAARGGGGGACLDFGYGRAAGVPGLHPIHTLG